MGATVTLTVLLSGCSGLGGRMVDTAQNIASDTLSTAARVTVNGMAATAETTIAVSGTVVKSAAKIGAKTAETVADVALEKWKASALEAGSPAMAQADQSACVMGGVLCDVAR